MMKRQALAPLMFLSLMLAGCSGSDDAQGGPPALPVTVAKPLVKEVTEWDDYVGRFEAVDSVEVRPRASGYLQRSHFTDGQYVRAGQLLFTIDARPSQAALDQARAQLARSQATLANARTELARSETLAKSQAASQEEVESRRAAVRTGEADVAAARAAIRGSELNVGFTRVTAPISGRVSQRLVDPGNSVTADQTVLTTIVSTNPLHFTFQGSEASLLDYERQGDELEGSPVRIRLQGETDYTRNGRIDFVDNALSSGSGTIAVRAIVQNPDGKLRPGLFGQLQLAASAPRPAMMLPDTAIVTDGARRVVYVIGKKDVVQARPVQLGPVVGGLRVIRSGITEQDRVIVNGLQRARPGQPAKVEAGTIAADGKVLTPKGAAPAGKPKGDAK
ncbi:efflux RND transporter periplasmic adaptor subunit [Sphingopyxis witflariensis]|uniref:Efflux transporter periplasmic adaptor subunit n=1 Tax=Sphingopyxis witflariensis TaxID=173675 RepID=A0A246K353_9SPHN|nr:efflux RND transporter periplasmic adaptor subunit [Sphingopyxis witflariensis]OWR00010.1 efflux transporter periplasmic adaptor subunit [Sphingopyxis witflariensis]